MKNGLQTGKKNTWRDTMAWEFTILDAIQQMRTPFLDFFFKSVTLLGEGGLFCIALGLVLLIPKKTRTCGICVLAALVLDALVCNVTLKPLVARERPCWVNTSRQTLISSPRDFSFPSGHTAVCFAAGAALYMNNRKWGIFSFVLAALVGFSRLYLYMHWPTDVLAGMVVGAAAGILAAKMVLYWKNFGKNKKLS